MEFRTINATYYCGGILDIESGIVQSKTKRRQLIERFNEDDIRKNIATDLDVIDAAAIFPIYMHFTF